MSIASVNEDIYQKFEKLREIARGVYEDKIIEKEVDVELSFEEICNTVLYSFDESNQSKVAEQLGLPRDQMILQLICLSNGARLDKQGK